jgi:sec-independent protein translocase protein TatB
MARDLGRFVTEARRSIDEFKEELTAGADDEEADDEEADDEEEDPKKKGGERDL